MSVGSGERQALRVVTSATEVAPPRPARLLAEPLVGRRSELARATWLLTRSTRLLTVTGPGGVGKSRFAAEVAAQLHEEFDGDVVDVPLGSVRDPDLVMAAIARAAGLDAAGDRDSSDVVTDGFGERRMLLCLDNLEQVIDCAPRLGALMERCASIHIVATSRVALRIGGEVEFALEPLEVPPPGSAASDDIAEVESVVMLSQAVRQFDHDFTIDATNAAPIAEICRRVEGLPLAIELAAARLRVLSPADLADLLQQRLDLLRNDRRDTLPHQRTLRSTIDWSYRLLDAERQAVLRAIGVFPGGFTLEAAAAVMEVDTYDALDHLDHLVGHHLVRVDVGADVAHPFDLFESIRQFAADELVAVGENDRRRDAHVSWVTMKTEEWAAALLGPGQADALSALDVEIDNIRAALRWAIAAGDGHEGLRIATALWRYWWLRGRLKEGRMWLDRALAEYPGESESPLAAAYKAAACKAAADMAAEDSDVAAAESLLDQALTIYSTLDDPGGIADCWYSLALIARDRGDLDLAETLLDDSIVVFTDLEHHRKGVVSLSALATIAYVRGDLSAAETRTSEVVQLARELGDRVSLGQLVGNLGLVQLAQGDTVGAVQSQEEALAIARELHDAAGTANAIANLAVALLAATDVERAESLLSEAADLYREMGDPRGSATVTYSLGRCAARRGDHRRAGELWLQALAKYVADQANPDIACCLESIAGSATAARAFDEAIVLFSAASALRDRDGSVPSHDVEATEHNRRIARAGVTDEAAEALVEQAAAWSLDEVERAAIECVERLGLLPVQPADGRARLADQLGLTVRELDVVELVVDHQTDREIAEKLFISPRTVTTHVSAILRKLGVTSRREVAAVVAERTGWAVLRAR